MEMRVVDELSGGAKTLPRQVDGRSERRVREEVEQRCRPTHVCCRQLGAKLDGAGEIRRAGIRVIVGCCLQLDVVTAVEARHEHEHCLRVRFLWARYALHGLDEALSEDTAIAADA